MENDSPLTSTIALQDNYLACSHKGSNSFLRKTSLALACASLVFACNQASADIVEKKLTKEDIAPIRGLNADRDVESSNPLARHNEWFTEYNTGDPRTSRLIITRDSLYKRPNPDSPLAKDNPFAKTDAYLYPQAQEKKEVYNISSKPSGDFIIPSPNAALNYAGNGQYTAQGNAFVKVRAPSSDSSLEATPEEINPLASPDYDPFTGKIVPKEKKEDVKVQEVEQKLSPIEEMQKRLAEYDREMFEKARSERDLLPFGDFIKHDEEYNSISKTADVFYLDRERDKKALQEKISKIESNIDAEIGIAVLGDDGIILIKDNTEFPLYGISNFHLAYAVASLMHTRDDDLKTQVHFNTNTLKRNVISPMAETLLAGLGGVIAKESGVEVYNSNQQETKKGKSAASTAERSKAIAASAKAASAGEKTPSARDAGLRTVSAVQNDIFKDEVSLDVIQDKGHLTSLGISNLLNYSLGQSDGNASNVLVSYLGTLPSLEMFIKTKSLTNTHINFKDTEVYSNPDLGYENRGPLYESAKLYALYLQDKNINEDVRHFIDETMYFNHSSKEAIQRGVRNSIRNDDEEAQSNLKIYSREGVSETNSVGRRVSVSDLAYIEYKDRRYIIAICVKDIPGNIYKTASLGEKTIAFVAKTIFDYLNTRPDISYQPGQISKSIDSLKALDTKR